MRFQVDTLKNKLFERAFFIKKSDSPAQIYAEIACVVFLLFLTLSFSNERLSPQNLQGVRFPFLDIVNLVFHEAGHILFIPMGKFMAYLGGSLFQCLIPVILMGYFLKERASFSASVMFWWLGQNFIDLAPYIYDAKRLTLTLLGGHTGRDNPNSHDWYWLLSQMGVRQHCESIGLFFEGLGFLILLLALTWSVLLLFKRGKKQFQPG